MTADVGHFRFVSFVLFCGQDSEFGVWNLWPQKAQMTQKKELRKVCYCWVPKVSATCRCVVAVVQGWLVIVPYNTAIAYIRVGHL